MAWQPIETMPLDDGSRFLVRIEFKGRYAGGIPIVYIAKWYQLGHGYGTLDIGDCETVRRLFEGVWSDGDGYLATHWQPLPDTTV